MAYIVELLSAAHVNEGTRAEVVRGVLAIADACLGCCHAIFNISNAAGQR
jgi:hypothetical protein